MPSDIGNEYNAISDVALLTMTGLAGFAAGEPSPEFMTEVKLSIGGKNSTDRLAQEMVLVLPEPSASPLVLHQRLLHAG
jgi:hypothetical protein